MRKNIIKASAACLYIGALTSCSTSKPLYSWYDYEDATYTYSKKPTPEQYDKMIATYVKIGEKQNGLRGKVPPGFNAEYGYQLYKEGKKEEGLKYLNKEIEDYPESKVYISRIIKQIEKQ
ncbi:MAG TPA: DUF4810 domain-containing protein [Prevotellaceae bacterium]|nr:DUF4810 domain-containing protein [Prevotellaceae bacterium]